MRRKKIYLKILAFLVLISSISYGIKVIFFPDENVKIRKTISMAVDELENKDIGRFIKHFTLDYRDSFNNTYGTLYILLRNNIDMIKTIDIGISQMEIEIEKSQATIKFLARAIITSSEGEMYKEAGRFIMKMRKEDFKWKIFKIEDMEYDFE